MSDTTCSQPGSQLSLTQELKCPSQLKPRSSSMFTSCRICLSSMFDPAALTCGHKFCEGCLDQYWQLKEKPNFLICPLCRAHAFNIDFTEKEDKNPDGEFRKNFSTLQQINDAELNKSTLTCFKISMLIPIVYYLVKWLKSPILELVSLLKLKFCFNM